MRKLHAPGNRQHSIPCTGSRELQKRMIRELNKPMAQTVVLITGCSEGASNESFSRVSRSEFAIWPRWLS